MSLLFFAALVFKNLNIQRQGRSENSMIAERQTMNTPHLPKTSARDLVFPVITRLALLFLWTLAQAAALATTPTTNTVEVTVRNDRSTNIFFSFVGNCPPPAVSGGAGFSVADEPEHGSITHLPDLGQSFAQYTPTAGYVGEDSFVIRRTQSCTISPDPPFTLEEFTVVLVQVLDPNRPFAIGQSLSVNEDTPLTVTLSGIAQSAEPLTFAILTAPGHGTLSGTPPNVIYTPAPNYHGPDSFTFEASDTVTNSAPATISITVLAVNDPPVAVASLFPEFQLFPNLTMQLVLAANGTDAVIVFDGSESSDADGDVLTFAWFETGQLAPFALGPTTTNVIEVGYHSVTLMVDDGVATGTAVSQFQVITPGEALEIIIEQLDNSSLARNTKRPLLASLKTAYESLDRGQFTNAANQLLALENKIRAQISREDPALAGQLIQAVEMLRQAIRGG